MSLSQDYIPSRRERRRGRILPFPAFEFLYNIVHSHPLSFQENRTDPILQLELTCVTPRKLTKEECLAPFSARDRAPSPTAEPGP